MCLFPLFPQIWSFSLCKQITMGGLVKEYLPIAVVTVAVIYAFANGIFTTIARTYLFNYYSAAHIALLAIFCSFFVISHHVFKVRHSLDHQEKTFSIVQIIFNVFYFFCCFITFIGYCTLCGLSIHTNYDYVAAVLISLINCTAMGYLMVVVVYGIKRGKLWIPQSNIIMSNSSSLWNSRGRPLNGYFD